MNFLDINCGMGELPEAILRTLDATMPYLSSANIFCGCHAGDDDTVRTTVAQAIRHRLSLSAHRAYPDRANCGRLKGDQLA